jgi:phospholipid-binding lipoprotein MlaA
MSGAAILFCKKAAARDVLIRPILPDICIYRCMLYSAASPETTTLALCTVFFKIMLGNGMMNRQSYFSGDSLSGDIALPAAFGPDQRSRCDKARVNQALCMNNLITKAAIVGMAFLVAACSTTPMDERTDERDTFENANRSIYNFNMKADTYVLEPAADLYRSSVPQGGQRAVDQHLRWAAMPSTAINSTLQGKFENAGLAALNFLVNGLTLGFADLTEDEDTIEQEDFGQTLAAYKAPEGPYVMMPLLGPRTGRALAGNVVDFAMNPLRVFGSGKEVRSLRQAQAPVGAISFRAKTFDAFNEVKYKSIDPYARTRSFYYQIRLGLLEDRVTGTSTTSEDAFEFLFDE